MAIFGNKGGEGEGTKNGDASGGIAVSPEKAKAFFDRARTVHDTTNYEYAMTMWLSGLRLQPSSLPALEGFWKSAVAFESEQGNKLGKDTRKGFTGKGEVEGFLSAMLDWGVEPVEPTHPVKAAEYAAKIHAAGVPMREVGDWILARATRLVEQEKKPKARKSLLVKLMDAAATIGLFDYAVKCGDAASKLDPSDIDLATRTRNMAAQATMSSGGYDKTGQEGGFRSNIRDADKQRRLEETERIGKSEDTKERVLSDWEREYQAKPGDVPTVNQYVKALLERGRPEDERQAYSVLNKAFESTHQFHFRQKAGEIRLRQARRKLEEYRSAAAANPADEKAQNAAQIAGRKYLEMELQEYRLRVENYPTDVGLKFELGKREFDLGNNEQAIALFQESQQDPRNRTVSMTYLGQAFSRMGWVDEAIDTFRKACEWHQDMNDATGMELRYALLCALQAKAATDRSLEAAQEAEKLASSIAIQQISYRDIRDRRDALKKLVSELRQVRDGGTV